MRTIRVMLAAFLGSAGLVLGVAGPAAACSCVAASTEELVGYADVVVTGTLTDAQDPPLRQVVSSGDPVTYTVAVEQVFKGDASGELELTSAMSGASCGLERMVVDRRYTFFLDAEGTDLTASLCGGTAPARAGLERRVIRSTGPPTGPADVAPGSTTTDAVAAPEATAASSTADRWAWPAAGSGVVAIAAGWWLWVRRSRRYDAPNAPP